MKNWVQVQFLFNFMGTETAKGRKICRLSIADKICYDLTDDTRFLGMGRKNRLKLSRISIFRYN